MPFPHWSIMPAFSLTLALQQAKKQHWLENTDKCTQLIFLCNMGEREENLIKHRAIKKKKKEQTILSWWITLTQLNKNTLAIPKSRAHFIFICNVTLLMVSVTKPNQNKSLKQTKSQISGMQSSARWIRKVGQWVINANLTGNKLWPAEKEEV